MATTFSVDSRRCDHETRLTAAREGKTIKIEIRSTCERVQAYAEALTEVSMKDIAKAIMDNPIYVTASCTVGPECVVPCAVVSATWTEAGMVARSLLKQYPTTGFVYEEDPQ